MSTSELIARWRARADEAEHLGRTVNEAALLRTLAAELSAVAGNGTRPEERAEASEDVLLTAREAAARLGVTLSWIYDNATRLTFTRRIGPKTAKRKLLRFSSRGLELHKAKQS